jgi:hypothetical protein
LYSAAWPHLGQVSMCVRSSVVSLKKSRSSMARLILWLRARRSGRRGPHFQGSDQVHVSLLISKSRWHFLFTEFSSILVLAVPKRKPVRFSATKAVKANARDRVGQPKPARVLVDKPRTGRQAKHKPKLQDVLQREE